MSTNWDLKRFYSSYNDEKYKQDYLSFEKQLQDIKAYVSKEMINYNFVQKKTSIFINMLNIFNDLYERLMLYTELLLSVDTQHKEAKKHLEILQSKITEIKIPEVKFQKWVASFPNKKMLLEASTLSNYSFYLQEIIDKSAYLLSENEENILAKLQNTGSSAWQKLFQLLTSTLTVKLEEDGKTKEIPLSMARSLAHSEDGLLRKNAYLAEIEAYSKIDESIASAISNIKGEVITTSNLRGFDSPLDMTLFNSRLDRDILNVMLDAIQDYLPFFQKYLKKKAQLLGYDKALPFYDLFAPIGSGSKKFTYPEAQEYIINHFGTFSEDLAAMAQEAFNNSWIDLEPKSGKVGGAFCAGVRSLKESRILTNFTGNLSDVITLGHELGHAFHNTFTQKEDFLNSDYPMPLAETASIFCETILFDAALEKAEGNERLSILETSLKGKTQVIVDIYSRYLFETELFKLRESESPGSQMLQSMMIKAQKQAYGDALDSQYLHPFMWLNKPHYYEASYNFYNFPYAFGLLFALGLYSQYKSGDSDFSDNYKKLLQNSGKDSIKNVCLKAGFDISNKSFWTQSLDLIKTEIEEFCK